MLVVANLFQGDTKVEWQIHLILMSTFSSNLDFLQLSLLIEALALNSSAYSL